VDAIRNIETVAKNESRLLTDERNRQIDEVVTEMAGTIRNEFLAPAVQIDMKYHDEIFASSLEKFYQDMAVDFFSGAISRIQSEGVHTRFLDELSQVREWLGMTEQQHNINQGQAERFIQELSKYIKSGKAKGIQKKTFDSFIRWTLKAHADFTKLSKILAEKVPEYRENPPRPSEAVQAEIDKLKKRFKKDFTPDEARTDAAKKYLTSYITQHQKVEWLVRALDGYQDQGPVWQYVVLPFMRAMDKEGKMRRDAGEKYAAILHQYFGKDLSHLTKKLDTSDLIHIFKNGLTKENILMFALNWGSKTNRQRVIDSYMDEFGLPLADESTFTQLFNQYMEEKDWQFCQDIWDLVGSFWPALAEVEKIRKGVEPKKVQAEPVQTPYGTFPGGYFHVEYDVKFSEQAARYNEQDNLKGLTEISYLKPSTKTGMTKERFDRIVGRPLRLNLSVIDKHLADVIHLISFINGLRDVDRVLNDKRVERAIKDIHGDEVYKQFRPWLMAIGYDHQDPVSPVEKILNHARVGSSIVNMGWKLSTAFSQYAGLFAFMERLGPARTIAGVLDFHSGLLTGKAKKQIDFVFEKSEMMRRRGQERDRDIAEATRKLVKKGKYDGIKDSYFALTSIFDLAITIPGWIQSYEKYCQDQAKAGKVVNEELAIRYADGIIRETQGSGDTVNLAAIQRGSGFQKLFTQFYSYFSVYANRQIEAVQRVKRNGEYGQLIAFSIYWWFLPAVAGELLAGRAPDDGEDPVSWLASTILKYPTAGFVVLRDVVNAFGSKIGGYEMSPTGEALDSAVKLYNQTINSMTEGEDIDWGKVTKTVFQGSGYWLHLPAKQISITAGNILDAIVNQEDFQFRDLFFSKQPSRR
jgi:hypothetical protein